MPQRDDFATNAMIWAYSTKTDIGEQKIFYRKNNWVLLEKTNDGFIELGQYNNNHYDFINEEVNKHNEGLYNSGIDERIYSSIMRYENLGINDSRNYGNDVGQQTSNGRIGETHQEQSESNRSGDSQRSSENKQKYSRELDTEYLSAVNRGDMETAQKMVDEAAKKAGYDSGGAISYTAPSDLLINIFDFIIITFYHFSLENPLKMLYNECDIFTKRFGENLWKSKR